MTATKALITNANGLARLVAPLPDGEGVTEEDLDDPDDPDEPVLVASSVVDASTEAVAVLVVWLLLAVSVARLNVWLREIGIPVPPELIAVPIAVPIGLPAVPMRIAVVAFLGTTVVVTRVLFREAIAERAEEIAEAAAVLDDETDCDDAAALDVEAVALVAEEEAKIDVIEAAAPDPPEKVNFPE